MSAEQPATISPSLQSFLKLLTTLLVPAVLVLGVVRLMISPAYLNFEYNTPGFPADSYGFSKEERLRWARFAVDYLVNEAGIEYLGDLRFPAGQQAPPESCRFMDDCTRLYNDRELQHMLDVKLVVQAAMRVWAISAILLIFFGIGAWRWNWWEGFRLALGRGGWLTVLLLGSIILFVLLAFGVIFVAFHNVFFDSGTWVFFYSDTLIRLFPERFWRDTFIAVGVLAGGAGALIGLLMRPKPK
jgi:integral membrane protein (TIGR01906 family)